MLDTSLVIAQATDEQASRRERFLAFSEIVHRFQDIAVGYAYSIIGDSQLAEDAAQEAFVEAWSSLHQLNEPRAFAGWFRQIVFTKSRRILRGDG